MQAEEAVVGAPVFEEGLTLFEERRDPAITDMGIEGIQHVIDHPEDGLTALGLTKVIALTSPVHLLDGYLTSLDPRPEEVEVIRPTGLYHFHGGQDEVSGIARIIRVEGHTCQVAFDHLNVQADFPANRLKGVAENFVPLHRLARVS